MRTVGVVTVARSDYGIYRPVLRALAERNDVRLQLYVGGMHLLDRFGLALRGKLARREDARPGIELARMALAQFPEEDPELRRGLEKTLVHLEKKLVQDN